MYKSAVTQRDAFMCFLKNNNQTSMSCIICFSLCLLKTKQCVYLNVHIVFLCGHVTSFQISTVIKSQRYKNKLINTFSLCLLAFLWAAGEEEVAEQHGAVRADRSTDQRTLQEISQDGQSAISGKHTHTHTNIIFTWPKVCGQLNVSLFFSSWWRRFTAGWWWSIFAPLCEAESSAPLWRWGRGWPVGSETKANRSKSSSRTWSVWKVKGHD